MPISSTHACMMRAPEFHIIYVPVSKCFNLVLLYTITCFACNYYDTSSPHNAHACIHLVIKHTTHVCTYMHKINIVIGFETCENQEIVYDAQLLL